MPQKHLNHHINVDDSNVATVTNQLLTGGPTDHISLVPHDIVTFTSNRTDSTIRYKGAGSGPGVQAGSPFDALAPGAIHSVNLGTIFEVSRPCEFDKRPGASPPQHGHFVFECGHGDSPETFTLWDTPGGTTPGPND